MTTKEVADFMKISTQQVRRLVYSGTLPCIKISDRILRFSEEDIKNFIKGARL